MNITKQADGNKLILNYSCTSVTAFENSCV